MSIATPASALNETATSPQSAPKSRVSKLVWIAQLVAAAILASTLPFKFSAAPETVELFEKLGAGAAGRIGTALMETIAVLLLLTPRLASLGGLLTVGLMGGAIMGHLTVLGIKFQGDAGLFTMAVIAFVSGATVVWMRRTELPIIGKRFA